MKFNCTKPLLFADNKTVMEEMGKPLTAGLALAHALANQGDNPVVDRVKVAVLVPKLAELKEVEIDDADASKIKELLKTAKAFQINNDWICAQVLSELS